MSRQELHVALDALSAAHGTGELMQAMRTVQRQVRRVRAIEGKVIGRLASAYLEAIELRDRLQADGMSGPALDAGLEGVLRQYWPFTRTWKYLCQDCDDTGLQLFHCRRGQRCNGISTRTDGPRDTHLHYRRLCASDPDADYEHDYGEPCLCTRGERFRGKPKPDPSAFADAGKTSTPRGWSRMGR